MTHTIKVFRSTTSGPVVMTFRTGDENSEAPLIDAKTGVANLNAALDQIKTWVAGSVTGTVNEIDVFIKSSP